MLCTVLTAALWSGPSGLRSAPDDSTGERSIGIPVVFFPPTPPIYGSKIDNQPVGTSRLFLGRRLTPPDGMADFAGDLFYPPLSTRLYSLALSRQLEARIQRYRTTRNLLVSALLDRCTHLHDATPEAREQDLRAFAAEQSPRIAALEAEADELRRDLVRGSLFSSVDWNSGRSWRLDTFPPDKEWATREAEFQVVRAAAFYQDGLTLAQRGLLCELATELESVARKARGEPTFRGESDAMFFSPEQTRLRLPPDLPSATLAKIAAYNSQKAALKQELRAAVRDTDQVSASKRHAIFARLAEDQWPRLGILETLADEIRPELARRFEPAPPKRPPAIPSWLVADITTYNEDRDTYFGELRERIRGAVERVSRPPRSESEDDRIQQEQEFLAQQAEARRQATIEFQQAHKARFLVLEQQYRAIREGLEVIAKTATDEKTGRPLDVEGLLRQHGAAMAEFDGFGRAIAIYVNYRRAMLEPGLAPEQRRLLFSYALVGLAQPLPYGEPLPRRAAKYPLPR